MGMKTMLEEELSSQLETLHHMEVGSAECKRAVSDAMIIADHILAIQKQNDEYELRKLEIENAAMSNAIEHQKLQKKDRNDYIKFGISLGAYLLIAVGSMYWEKFDTVTSTAGRSSLKELLTPRFLK